MQRGNLPANCKKSAKGASKMTDERNTWQRQIKNGNKKIHLSKLRDEVPALFKSMTRLLPSVI